MFSILFTLLLLPWINKLTHAQLELPLSSPLFYAISFAGIFVIGLLAGIYPSIFLSSFNPILALKGKLQLSKGRFQPRKVMVVIQFAISIFMMIATYLVIQQLYYVKERPIGYNNQNLINVISSSPEIRKNFEVLKETYKIKDLFKMQPFLPILSIDLGYLVVGLHGKVMILLRALYWEYSQLMKVLAIR